MKSSTTKCCASLDNGSGGRGTAVRRWMRVCRSMYSPETTRERTSSCRDVEDAIPYEVAARFWCIRRGRRPRRPEPQYVFAEDLL